MKNNNFYTNYRYYFFLLYVFALMMVFFTLFRVLLLFLNFNLTNGSSNNDIYYALFNRGLLFDANILSYTIAIPFLLITFGYKYFKVLNKIIFIYFVFAVILLTVITCADFPFFNYYNSRITTAIVSWSEEGVFSFLVIFTNKYYYPYTILFILVSTFLIYIINKIFIKTIKTQKEVNVSIVARIILFVIIGVFLFLGIRGDYKLNKKPLQEENTFFSPNTFVNQLGINPVFSFFSSSVNNKIDYGFDNKTAIANVQHYLNINPDKSFKSPIARIVNGDNDSPKYNVIIILLESFSADRMKINGNPKNLTPFLDSIAINSIFFKNTYAAGIHTYNGIFASLYGLPTILSTRPLKSVSYSALQYNGIVDVLKSKGYKTMFFVTGDDKFDNLQNFLPNHSFDRLFSSKDYKNQKVFNEWGVTDKIMYDCALQKFDSTFNNSNSFLGVMLTISSHYGCGVPTHEGFVPNKKYTSEDNNYLYSDWALQKFIDKCRTKKWFSNTIFVFVADHGQAFDRTYDLSLSYMHIPLIIYNAPNSKNKIYDKLAMQIDITPTILGLMNVSYINNNLGIDLINQNRKYAYFCADNKIGCVNQDYFMIMSKNQTPSLYKYKSKDKYNYYSKNIRLADSMKTYTYSMFKTLQYLIDNKLSRP